MKAISALAERIVSFRFFYVKTLGETPMSKAILASCGPELPAHNLDLGSIVDPKALKPGPKVLPPKRGERVWSLKAMKTTYIRFSEFLVFVQKDTGLLRLCPQHCHSNAAYEDLRVYESRMGGSVQHRDGEYAKMRVTRRSNGQVFFSVVALDKDAGRGISYPPCIAEDSGEHARNALEALTGFEFVPGLPVSVQLYRKMRLGRFNVAMAVAQRMLRGEVKMPADAARAMTCMPTEIELPPQAVSSMPGEIELPSEPVVPAQEVEAVREEPELAFAGAGGMVSLDDILRDVLKEVRHG